MMGGEELTEIQPNMRGQSSLGAIRNYKVCGEEQSKNEGPSVNGGTSGPGDRGRRS